MAFKVYLEPFELCRCERGLVHFLQREAAELGDAGHVECCQLCAAFNQVADGAVSHLLAVDGDNFQLLAHLNDVDNQIIPHVVAQVDLGQSRSERPNDFFKFTRPSHIYPVIVFSHLQI
jgi:hypothetical protein